MKQTDIFASIILIACVFISLTIVMFAYDQSQDLGNAQKDLKDYNEKMSNPVNALDPVNSIGGTVVGELIIPKLGVDCTIRSDTVNAYDAVYHYPESVGFGQPGEVGLLGHRTTYSHLFIDIGTLQIGDKAIIIDTSTQKKYTYAVTSNGNDIRWDYKTNPVRFAQDGEARLLIMTCYPPGKKEAAYITHFKLISTENI